MSESTQAPQGEFRCPQCGVPTFLTDASAAAYCAVCNVGYNCPEAVAAREASDVLAARREEGKDELVVCFAKTVDGKPLTHEQSEELHRFVNERHKTPHGICPWCDEVYPLEGSSVREFAESHLPHCKNHPMRVVEQQLAEAREQLADIKLCVEHNGCDWDDDKSFAQNVTSELVLACGEWAEREAEVEKLQQQLAAEKAERDRLAAEVVMLREAVEILDWGQWADGDGDFCQECGEFKSKGHAPGCRIFKALANSPATAAEAERVRRLERFVEKARRAVVSPVASGTYWSCYKMLDEALAALDAKGGAT